MVAVAWALPQMLRTPAFGAVRDRADNEALAALTYSVWLWAVDATSTLNWSFPVHRALDYRQPDAGRSVSDCMDERAEQIWREHPDGVTVLCAGDIHSTSILAALYAHAREPARLTARYTRAGWHLDPDLFDTLLPKLGVTVEWREGQTLVGDSTQPYCDGRGADDWQAAYLNGGVATDLEAIGRATLDEAIATIATECTVRPDRADRIRASLERWIEACPWAIDSGWALTVAAFRALRTQADVMTAGLIEDDPKRALAQRVAFHDHPLFNDATARIIERGLSLDEGRELKDYTRSVLGETDWQIEGHSLSTSTFYRYAHINTHWMDGDYRPQPYSAFAEVMETEHGR
jgi:hypothetical protein